MALAAESDRCESTTSETDREDFATGYRNVESTASCVITRFRMKSRWGVLGCYLHFRRIRAAARRHPGLLAAVFAVGENRACYSISLWADDASILRFHSSSRAHVNAGNWLFGRMATTSNGKPELWSAKFGLSAVSQPNLRWEGVKVPYNQEAGIG